MLFVYVDLSHYLQYELQTIACMKKSCTAYVDKHNPGEIFTRKIYQTILVPCRIQPTLLFYTFSCMSRRRNIIYFNTLKYYF